MSKLRDCKMARVGIKCDWMLDDAKLVKKYLAKFTDFECVLLDVVVPTYRLDMAYLARIGCLAVPENVRTTAIVVVDNPAKLKELHGIDDIFAAALAMETQLAALTSNNIRVR